MSDGPPVTVVVPCRDRAALLDRCLGRLREVLPAGDDIVVVDSASSTDDVQRVAQRHGANVVRCELPGASRARNAGWVAARSSYVLFVDDDVLVTPQWRDALVAALDAGVGFAAGRSVPVVISEPAGDIVLGQRGIYGASNNLGVARAVLEQVGGFDERIGPGRWLSAGEDLELLDRILRAGHRGRYVTSAVADHVQWRTPRARTLLLWSYGKGMGARVAALALRDPALAWRLRGELARRSGRAAPTTTPAPPTAPAAGRPARWLGGALWRLGAVVGLVVGLVTLRPPIAAATAPAPPPRGR